MKIREKTKLQKINSDLKWEENAYPKPIELKLCSIKQCVKGKERDILETLLAFNSLNEIKSKHRHDLSKDPFVSELQKKALANDCNDKIYSLDVDGRTGNYRMLYCLSKIDNHCVPLHLCTKETHKG